MQKNKMLDCGWGKILFPQTFSSVDILAEELKKEEKKQRNIAFGIEDSKIKSIFSKYPQDFFLNPAYTYSINLEKFSGEKKSNKKTNKNFRITLATTEEEIQELNKIYEEVKMIPLKKNWISEKPKSIEVYIAREENTDKILAGCMVIDHYIAFEEIEKNCSLWALAVDKKSVYPGIGRAIMNYAIKESKKKKKKNLILSLIKKNFPAIKFYESLGFEKNSLMSIKNKTAINKHLFT